LYSTQFFGLKVLTSEGIIQCFREHGMADKIPEGKTFDDMEETEKDEVMKNFI
jgi:hypothetical protein